MVNSQISRLAAAHKALQECLWTVRLDELSSLAPMGRIENALRRSNKGFDDWMHKLLAVARKTAPYTYCDYSHYGLGASALAFDGKKLGVIGGANCENGAYTPTKHAEEAAVCNAQSAGYMYRARQNGLKKTEWLIALGVWDPNDLLNPVPCNLCRQFLLEFGRDLLIIGPGPEKHLVNATTLKIITPGAFVPEMVKSVLPKVS